MHFQTKKFHELKHGNKWRNNENCQFTEKNKPTMNITFHMEAKKKGGKH